MSYTNQYQYYPIEEHEKLIQLVAKNQMAGVIYLTLRQKADYNTGEIVFNISDFKEYFDSRCSASKKQFQRAVKLIESFGLIQKVDLIVFKMQRKLKALILAHCPENRTSKPLDKVGKTEKNLTTNVPPCPTFVPSDNTMNHLDTVSKTKSVKSDVCPENVPQYQLTSYIDTMILDKNLQNKNIEAGDYQVISNAKNPFEKFAEYNKQSLENYANSISKEYKDICNKYNLSDTEANHLFSDFLKASKTTKLINPLGYFTMIVLNFIRNGHLKQCNKPFNSNPVKQYKSKKVKNTGEIDIKSVLKVPAHKRNAEQLKVYNEYLNSQKSNSAKQNFDFHVEINNSEHVPF